MISTCAASTSAFGRALSSRSSKNRRSLDGLGVRLESDQVNESSGALVLSRSMVSGDKMRGRTKSLGIGASPIEDLLVESQTIDLGCLLRFRIGCIKQELQCPRPGDRHRVGHGRHAQAVELPGLACVPGAHRKEEPGKCRGLGVLGLQPDVTEPVILPAMELDVAAKLDISAEAAQHLQLLEGHGIGQVVGEIHLGTRREALIQLVEHPPVEGVVPVGQLEAPMPRPPRPPDQLL